MSTNDALKKQAKMRIFFESMRPKVIGLLCRNYGLREDEAADCFQEGSIAMWKNINEGKITLDAIHSLPSYLIRCCCNHATKALRYQMKTVAADNMAQLDCEVERPMEYTEEQEGQIDLLVTLVQQLDEPCHSIIWGFYRHKYTMEQMAVMFNYNSADVVRTQKSRCMKKLKSFAQQHGLTNTPQA